MDLSREALVKVLVSAFDNINKRFTYEDVADIFGFKYK